MSIKIVKLSKWAELNGYTKRGAYGRYASGNIEGAFKTSTGRVMVNITNDTITKKRPKIVVYARVSSHKQKADLDRQAKRLSQFCTNNGWIVDRVVKEIASGLNDNRPKLNSVIKDTDVTKIVVEHKDRLTRFGFSYIKELSSAEIIVANPAVNEKDDLMQDLISVITSMTARYYGQRRGARKTRQLLEILE